MQFFYKLVLFLILIVFFNRNWRFVRQTIFKTIITRSPFYFIVLTLTSYKQLTIYILLICQFQLITIVFQSIFLVKTSFFFLEIAQVIEVKRFFKKKINLLTSKGSSYPGNMSVLFFLFINLFFFNFRKKRKNDIRLKNDCFLLLLLFKSSFFIELQIQIIVTIDWNLVLLFRFVPKTPWKYMKSEHHTSRVIWPPLQFLILDSENNSFDWIIHSLLLSRDSLTSQLFKQEVGWAFPLRVTSYSFKH